MTYVVSSVPHLHKLDAQNTHGFLLIKEIFSNLIYVDDIVVGAKTEKNF